MRFAVIMLILAIGLPLASSFEYPKFGSGISVNSDLAVDFSALQSKADSIHEVLNKSDDYIIWKFAGNGDWAIVKKDGTLIVASRADFTLSGRKELDSELAQIANLAKSIGGRITNFKNKKYHIRDNMLYRKISYSFNKDFDLLLNVPNCTISKAILDISGSDDADTDIYSNPTISGQHYFIDDSEVSGCDIYRCGLYINCATGISCGDYCCNDDWVTVVPVDITNKIPYGLHKITASGIANSHSLTIEALTSISPKEIVLYSSDYKININETRSSSIEYLYQLMGG